MNPSSSSLADRRQANEVFGCLTGNQQRGFMLLLNLYQTEIRLQELTGSGHSAIVERYKFRGSSPMGYVNLLVRTETNDSITYVLHALKMHATLILMLTSKRRSRYIQNLFRRGNGNIII
jgi:hypothetical protein